MNAPTNFEGKTIVLTGGSRGLGLYTAQTLHNRGARVIVGARSRGELDQKIRHIPLDLANLDSIAQFAATLKGTPIDCLINNAGVLYPPATLVHGCEAHIGINFLGPFALTQMLYPQLTPDGRTIHVTSMVARFVQYNDANVTGFKAYAVSKLANLLFALALAEKDTQHKAIAAHPGYTATQLQHTLRLGRLGNYLIGQPLPVGAKSLIKASTDPELTSGQLVGPGRVMQLRGNPELLPIYNSATSAETRAVLWAFAEEVLKLKFNPTG